MTRGAAAKFLSVILIGIICLMVGHGAAMAEAGSGPVEAGPVAAPTSNPGSLPATTGGNAVISSDAERVYAGAKPRLLQVRTLVVDTGQQSTLGSAFIVDPNGLAITNYHVVSQYALEPKTHRLEYAAPDGSSGPLKLLAIDVINDLAVISLDKPGQPYFKFNAAALSGQPLKGKRLYAMGNPLDLGFVIVEGTYNGLVDHSYNDRIHFSGAINAGMSGGPAVTVDGEVVGINVAKQIGSELVSFLVPARFAVVLLDRARSAKPLGVADIRAEISRQLAGWQAGLYDALAHLPAKEVPFGAYKVPEIEAPWFTCWASTNADDVPKPLAVQNTMSCNMNAQLFLASEVNTGAISYSYTYAKTAELNRFQFSSFLEKQYYLLRLDDGGGRYYTRRFCYENFVQAGDPSTTPLTRVVWCAQGYRDFDEVYDVTAMAVTQDRNQEALVTRVAMKGVSYPNGVAFVDRFLKGLQWAK
ncbi:MAG: serine protease [Pseudomonadota bacterium]|nr:serine protease [Pseudomonadota bacterium]